MSLEDFMYNLWRESLWKSSAKIAAMIAGFFHPGVAIVLILIFLPFYLAYRLIRFVLKLTIWLLFRSNSIEHRATAAFTIFCGIVYLYLR